VKLHIDHGLELMDNLFENNHNYTFFDFLIEHLDKGISHLETVSVNLDAVKNKFLDFFGFTTTDTTLEELLVVGAWSDPSLLRKLDLNTRNSTTANNILLEIKFQFKIHGVSGIKSGDIFEIEDLPKNYKDGLFQVVEVSHECNNNMWTTSVTGQYRKKDEMGTPIPPVG
jgi:hypothetical protein